MRALLAIIIFADGAAAFIGAVLASKVRTADTVNQGGMLVIRGHRPVITKVLMLGLFGYSIARFWNAWNNVANGQEVFECVRLISPRFLWNQYGALTLQAAMAWGATIYLTGKLMNGQVEAVQRRIVGIVRKLKPWK